jgi:Group II intron, maturase-specific domain
LLRWCKKCLKLLGAEKVDVIEQINRLQARRSALLELLGADEIEQIKKLQARRSTIRGLKLGKRTEVALDDITPELNPIVRGWIAYYGQDTPSDPRKNSAVTSKRAKAKK